MKQPLHLEEEEEKERPRRKDIGDVALVLGSP